MTIGPSFLEDKKRDELVGTLNWIMAFAMYEISASKYIKNPDSPEAAIHKATPQNFEPTWVDKVVDVVFGVLLLGMHATYRRRLWNAWPGFVVMHNFHELIAGAMQEWSGS